MRKRTLHVMALLAFAPTAVPATAQQPEIAVPNMISLRLGMNADETAEALGVRSTQTPSAWPEDVRVQFCCAVGCPHQATRSVTQSSS